MQLAGHLHGRALQEWGLLDGPSRKTYLAAVDSLRARLDPGSRTLAAQDFRHTNQREDEPVATFIRRLERTFQIAYGHDCMLTETRDTSMVSCRKVCCMISCEHQQFPGHRRIRSCAWPPGTRRRGWLNCRRGGSINNQPRTPSRVELTSVGNQGSPRPPLPVLKRALLMRHVSVLCVIRVVT